MMSRVWRIIVEQQNANHWTGWFADTPQIAYGGEWPIAAIEKLLAHFGEDQFISEEIVVVEHASRVGHLEFQISIRHYRRIPIPSVN